jgi:hypothetical protein
MLNQIPKNRKEVVIERGIMEIEGTLFKEERDKLKMIGEGVEFEGN